jgi:hypothetical protein
MRRVIRKKPSGEFLGALLLIIGLVILFTVLLKAWSGVDTSSNFLSTLWTNILSEELSVLQLVTLRLSYLSALAAIFLVLGIITLGFSRQVFYLSGESVTLTCPYCKNSWRARRAMGWAECPHCRKFIQPLAKKTAV